MLVQTETRRIEILLRYWNGGWNSGHSPDCFSDLETNFPLANPNVEGCGCAILANDKAVDELIDWWEEEVFSANKGYNHEIYENDDEYMKYGPEGECLAALTDRQRENGDEWILTVIER